MSKTIKEKVYSYIKDYKDADILTYNEDFESEFIEPDWFYYADDFTLNVTQDEDDPNKVYIVAYGLKNIDDYIETDWSTVLYREELTVEQLERI